MQKAKRVHISMSFFLKRTNLWQQNNFIKLWAGQTISLFGSAITTLALPLTAITILHATTFQMGLLLALGQISPLLFGFVVVAGLLFAQPWLWFSPLRALRTLPIEEPSKTAILV